VDLQQVSYFVEAEAQLLGLPDKPDAYEVGIRIDAVSGSASRRRS
jgi:hypothetical protein